MSIVFPLIFGSLIYATGFLKSLIVVFIIVIIDNKIVATCGLQVIKYMPQCVESGIEGYICDVFTLKELLPLGFGPANLL